MLYFTAKNNKRNRPAPAGIELAGEAGAPAWTCRGVELGNRVGAPVPGGLGRLQAGESGDDRQDQANFMGRWPARRPPRPLEKGRTKGRDSSIVCRQVARCAQCVPIDECGRISEGRERPARPEGGRKTSPHRVQSSFGQPHQTTPTINHRRLMSGQPSHGAVRRKNRPRRTRYKRFFRGA